jgi:hypothetical protein
MKATVRPSWPSFPASSFGGYATSAKIKNFYRVFGQFDGDPAELGNDVDGDEPTTIAVFKAL